MKKDKYNLFDHFFYLTLSLVVTLVLIVFSFMSNYSKKVSSHVNELKIHTAR